MGLTVDFVIHNKEIAGICEKYNLPVDIEDYVVKASWYVDYSPESYYGSYKNEFGNVASWLANVLVDEDIASDEYLNEKAPDADFSGASKAIEARAEELSRATTYSKYHYEYADEGDCYACYYSNEKQNGKIKIIDVICDEWRDEVLNNFLELILNNTSENIEKYAEEQGGIFFRVENDLFYGGIKNNTSSKTEKKTPAKTTKAKAKKIDVNEYDDDEYITVAEAIEKLSAIEEGIKALAEEAEAMAKEAEKREKEEKKKAQANKPKKKSKKSDFYVEDGELRAYHGNSEIVVVPDGVKKIAEYGLGDVNFVTEILISDSVEIIRDEAFVGTSITSIEIPANVKEIGEGVFKYCELLENISVSENNENYCSVEGALYTKDKKTLVAFPEGLVKERQETPSFVTEIAGFAFGSSENLKELIITDNVIDLKACAFKGFGSIEEVVFGKNLKSIGEKAFDGNLKIEKVVLNDGLEIIAKEAFASCSIKEIIIPGTVETIDERAFESNRTLEKVVVNEGVKSIGVRCFAACGKLTEVHLPASLEKIRATAFQSSNNIKKIYIPKDSPALESVRKITEKAGITLVEKAPVVSDVNVASEKPTTPSTNIRKATEVKSVTTTEVKSEPTNEKTVSAPPVKTENQKGKITGGDIFKLILVLSLLLILSFVIWLFTENIIIPTIIVVSYIILTVKKLKKKKNAG